MRAWPGRQWAVITSAAGTVFIAAGAFWLSFTSLADLARRSGIDDGQAWAWPLIVDGVIVVSTVAVVALGGERVAWYPWTLLAGSAAVSVTANSLHAVVSADADVPAGLAASVAAVPPVVLLAITHLTVILTRARPSEPADQTAKTAGAVSVALAPLTTMQADTVAITPSMSERAAGRRERAVELRESGLSNKKIARALDVHPSTVGRWFADAHQSDEPAQRDSAPLPEGATA
ncbi:helix-turn-helix domain-containing protein [Microbacterium dextranolyticum]|uniref:DUF2637 domain-containing protein n=1 Tax=Microbacterium dextranolyticum TaxID=36806 RepID=A0A9W6HPV1_9MICO|nr:helix-turn-helix domain-containing protein [Microbacterium dextranolyticum]MBM7462541.1 hypothetical protein [Microbacterium dextranolyticum]GLJ96399.1 hypothetical protein GCM10017591_24620 [Microbacterium dextranolyticum]